MKITKITFATLLAAATLFTSCKNEDIIGDIANADTYVFTRNGESTVSFGGQTTRLKQVNEIGGLLSDTEVTLADLEKRFKEGEGFTDADLNGTGKVVRSKVANSIGIFDKGATAASDEIKKTFDGYLASFISEVQPTIAKKPADVATVGTPGVADKERYVNAKGLEYNQAFYKGLIGGLVVDQVSNHYLNRLDDELDNSGNYRAANDADTVAEGKTYTTMEHHWDEAYGYVYGLDADDDSLLQKYIGRVEGDLDFKGIANTIFTAFGTGRKAIVDKDYTLRDAQISIIRKEIANVVGIRAVYYLQQSKDKLETREEAFHGLSEGYGFVYSLQFLTLDGETPLFTKAEVDGYIATLEAGNGFWDITAETLDDLSTKIAAKFDFTVAQAAE